MTDKILLKSRTRPICSILKIVLPFLILLISSPLSQQVSASDQKEVSQQQEKIDRVQKSILDHREKLKLREKKEKKLIKGLKKIDHRIHQESRQYVHLKQQIQGQEDLIKKKQKKLEKLKKEKNTLKSRIQKRLTAYYQMGDIGVINAFFSASSLTELLNFREMFKYMLRHDQQLFTSFRGKIRNITRTGKILEEERRKLEDAVSRAKVQQNILAEKRKERETLLKKVKTEKVLYHNAMAEMKAASRELQMTLSDLRGRAASESPSGQDSEGPLADIKKNKPPAETDFITQKGRLPPPISGNVLKKFHNDPASKEKSIFSEGINIETEPGDKVKAVHKGTVIYAGVLPGYGKMLILDHGNHYVSLVSGIADFIKEVGEQVEKGETIATASYHSGLLQEGIHFELRHKTEPIDPLVWLDRSELKTK